MKLANPYLILRITVAGILLAHSIPGIFDGGVNAFGKFYLNEVGFSPVGVPLAWIIKLSHIVCAILFLINRYILAAAIITIGILIMGIIMVHAREGWFVVGGGRNGIEYNVLLIMVIIAIVMDKRNNKHN